MERPVLFTVLGLLVVTGFSNAAAGPVPQDVAEASKSSRTSAPRRVSYRYSQRAPTVDRYKQIQQALKDRGYDPGPIDGRWGSKTAAALKRFERDNNLPPDGRLDSLAMIVLGLGPKRLSSVSSDVEKKTQ